VQDLTRRPFSGISPVLVGGTLGARLAATLFSFAAGVIAARSLGAHGRGVLAVLVAVPALFSVIGVLGLDTANLRFAGRSHTAFRQVVGRAVIFSLIAGGVLAAAWWLAGLRWPAVWLGLTPGQALLSAALCPPSVLLSLLAAAEIGRNRTVVYNLVTVGTMIIYLAGVMALLAADRVTITGCFVSYAASQVAGIVVLLILAGRRVQPHGPGVPLREYSGYALRAYLPNVAQYGMLRMDVPLIQVLAGTTAVGLYSVALPIAECLLLIPVTVALVMFPGVTSGRVDWADAKRIARVVGLSAAAAAALVATAAPFAVTLVYGTAFRGSAEVVWLMLPGIVVFSIARTAQTYLTATGRLLPVITASGAGVVACLGALAALVPRFGALGAGAADSAGYLVFSLVILYSLSRGGHLARWVQRVRSALRKVTPRVVIAASAITAAVGCAALSLLSPAAAAMAAGAAVLLFALIRPQAGTYLLAAAIPVSQTSVGATLVPARGLLALVLACLVGTLAGGQTRRPRLPVALSAVALIGYLLASVLLEGASGAPGAAVTNVTELAVPLLALPLITAARRDCAGRVIITFACSAAFTAVGEVLTARASLAAASGNTAVAAGQTGSLNHNASSAILVLALAVLLARIPRAPGGQKILFSVALAIVATGIAFSFSRASYFGALAVLGIFALRRSVRGVLWGGLIAAGLFRVLPAAVIGRAETVSSTSLDVSSALRLDLWTSAIRMFEARPLTGVGYLNFAAELPAYFRDTGDYSASAIQFSSLDFAHNTYLTVLAETGLVGAILAGVLIVAGWRMAWAALRSRQWTGESAVLAFAGIAVCSFFGEVLLVPAVLAAFLLVLNAAGGAQEAQP
jgi:O-antigen/teichoic acid export membrane protein/O-antigen ligase